MNQAHIDALWIKAVFNQKPNRAYILPLFVLLGSLTMFVIVTFIPCVCLSLCLKHPHRSKELTFDVNFNR